VPVVETWALADPANRIAIAATMAPTHLRIRLLLFLVSTKKTVSIRHTARADGNFERSFSKGKCVPLIAGRNEYLTVLFNDG
jgi:hypothetical protein